MSWTRTGSPGTTAPPTAGLLASMATWFWVEPTQEGDVAFLLFAYRPERLADESVGEIQASMRGLAHALGLAEPNERMPDIGPRLFMHRCADALLSLDGTDYLLHVPIGGAWARFACAGGPVIVMVGLEPLSAGTPLAAVDAYIAEHTANRSLFFGMARADRWRNRSPMCEGQMTTHA